MSARPDATKPVVPPAPDLAAELKRAKELLREWRDRYGGREQHKFSAPFPGAAVFSSSPTDLLIDTNRFLEGRR